MQSRSCGPASTRLSSISQLAPSSETRIRAQVTRGVKRWTASWVRFPEGVRKKSRSPSRMSPVRGTQPTGVSTIGAQEEVEGAFQRHSWTWRGFKTSYVVAGRGEPILLVHGFGACADHFRNNIPVLAQNYRVYALDLLGFGLSEKAQVDYSIELWADQITDFMAEFISQPAIVIGNSVGSLATLLVVSSAPENAVKGTVLLNCAGAMNNKALVDDWRLLLAYPIFAFYDFLLKIPAVAQFLFKLASQKENIRNVLLNVYGNSDAVNDELVDIIYRPSQDNGAIGVFVSVLTGPPGPRPESLMGQLQCPLLLLWGEEDPFTPMDGPVGKFFQKLAESRPNTQFIKLKGVGHCPHDDRPDLVHEQLLPWLASL